MGNILTEKQIRRLANIIDDINQVCIGSIILPPIILHDTMNVRTLFGLIVSISGVWISLRLERISDQII